MVLLGEEWRVVVGSNSSNSSNGEMGSQSSFSFAWSLDLDRGAEDSKKEDSRATEDGWADLGVISTLPRIHDGAMTDARCSSSKCSHRFLDGG